MKLTDAKTQGSKWISRLERSTEDFKKWERKFKCKELNDYYEGFQWKAPDGYEPYVTNLFYSTIQVKKPALLFRRPRFKVFSKPQFEGYDPELSWRLNQFRQDTLNTIITQNALKFAANCELAMLDTNFYFGIVEVGYSATWVQNPNAERLGFGEDYEDNVQIGEGKIAYDTFPLPENECVYVKRIPADRFRVSIGSNWNLSESDWCGYSEWILSSELKSEDSKFTNTEEITLNPSGTEGMEYDPDEKDATQQGNRVKIWKLWDLRAKKFNIVSTVDSTIIYQNDFRRLPLFALKFAHRRTGWYPIPLAFNWKYPQDEYNESREQLRAMRRRTKRVWQITKDSLDPSEIAKLQSGPDGTLIETSGGSSITPVQNPPIDNVTEKSLIISKDDFNIVSSTTSETRGESDRTTATQASITNSRSSIRETADRELVAEWLCEIGREIILQIREKFTAKTWIELNTAIGAFGQDYQDIQSKWQLIDPVKDLGQEGHDDISVEIEVESMSPIVNEQQKATFMEFLAVLNQYPQLSMNPILIREAAYRIGYRNEPAIKAFQDMAQIQMISMIEAGKQQLGQIMGTQQLGGGSGGGGASNMSQNTTEQMTPPTQGQIENQLSESGTPVG